ncbi:peptidase [Alcanivorax sp. N3-2A]|nr:peptidase [Alcanivorax sp. N3-2A]|tara:strand:- start:744 stop:2354 length:1611 start_codon:yes stop_codon:yes gene_type:complete
MKNSLRQSMAWLHTWSGLLLGWLLLAMFVTGTSAYFREEISLWMEPELHASHATPETPELAWQALNRLAPDARAWDIRLPDARAPVVELRWQPDTPEAQNEGRRRGERAIMDAATGEILTPRATRGGDFLYRFHFELYGVPRLWARWLVCVATMFMLVAIISGVITHKKIFKDFFTFRPGKGQRSWLDAHNATAVLALPFHFMITYSGLLLFMVMLMPWGIDAAYNGDRRAFFDDAFPRAAETTAQSQEAAPMTDIAPLLAQTRRAFDQPVTRIEVNQPNRVGATVSISTDRETEITGRRRGSAPTLVFQANSGALLETRPGASAALPAAVRFYNLFANLHLARFADPAVRWLFFLSGLGGCAMVATGLLLWSAKRTQQLKQRQPGASLRLVNALNMASMTGLIGAMAFYFAANRLLPVELAQRESWEIRVFFISWLLSLAHAVWRPNRRGWIEQLAGITVLWLSVPLLDMATTGSHLFSATAWQHGALAGFDLACLLLGALWGYALWRVARHGGGKKGTARQPRRSPGTATGAAS